MSFRCGSCLKPKQGAPRRVVIKTEPVTHPLRRDSKGNVIDNGGEGSRIVEERSICDRCAVAS